MWRACSCALWQPWASKPHPVVLHKILEADSCCLAYLDRDLCRQQLHKTQAELPENKLLDLRRQGRWCNSAPAAPRWHSQAAVTAPSEKLLPV